MTGLLLGPHFAERYRERLDAIQRETGAELDRIVLPEDSRERLPKEDLGRIDAAFFSGCVHPEHSPAFFSASLGAPKLRWLHCFNAGLDHPIFDQFRQKGIPMSNSPGSNAVPIAHSTIAGLLALSRRFPLFTEAQRERRWITETDVTRPPDLATQTLVVLGLGGIGTEIARLGRALGLHVVGVRRSRPPEDAPIDDWVPPDRLDECLPRADWLAIACPLSDETRGWIDAKAIARLPDGAGVLNVGRGEVVDEKALAEELASGRLGGAYLDVFEVEPLPGSSPLWGLPNVILTPHASSISAGSLERQGEMFLANLERFLRGEPLWDLVARG